MISADGKKGDSTALEAWFSVNAGDYLYRGDDMIGLDGKLGMYLKTQGEAVEDYPHVYLVTAPRFLGYVFNPVSFWYLYSDDMRLKAMILEVNNTFDERRIYFMKQEENINGDEKFANTWPKDFHVSPFNSRKGSYSLAATNPFASIDTHIDNNITLKSSKDHSKIVARLFSTGAAIDPLALTASAKIQLILDWFWVGFLTFPRILKEAAKLFFQQKLHVWYRPEVVQTGVGRRPTWRESIIEQCFKPYLAHYKGLASPTPPDPNRQEHVVTGELEFKVLTPQFYTEIVLANSPADYILNSSKLPIERQTFYAADAETAKKLSDMLTETTSDDPRGHSRDRLGFMPNIRWRLLSLLRLGHQHPLDIYVKRHIDQDLAESYTNVVSTLLLSRYLCFGFVEIQDLAWSVVYAGLVWTSMGVFLEDALSVFTSRDSLWNTNWIVSGWLLWEGWRKFRRRHA